MKRYLLAIMLGMFALSGYCQSNISESYNYPECYDYNYKYYKDSITESYYPRMFNLSRGSLPFVPLPSSGTNYRSTLDKIILAPGDTIRCVLEVIYYSKKDPYKKSYGKAKLFIKRFKDGKIYPYGNYTVEKWLKRYKKRLKFNLDYVVHNVNGGKTKTITALINYDAVHPASTTIDYRVKTTSPYRMQ